ncbi:DMT family transporter [Aliiroseovarius marinus]|uniref:DMT family transporter n=1 Tax=Aliiroseovarius marinus TaxID=2500159 RepID=UPI003D7EB185
MPATLKAALWMLGSILSFSAMAVAGRQLGGVVDTFELMFYRSAVGVLIVFPLLFAKRVKLHELCMNWRLQLIRNIAHFTGQNLWFLAVTLIPLAQVFALEFTSPLWVVLLSPLLIKDHLTRRRLIAVLLGFAGVMVIVQPGASSLSAGTVYVALAAICFALTAIFTRQLTQTNGLLVILAWLTGSQLVMGGIMAGWDGNITLPTAHTAPLLVLIGLAGLIAHTCLTRALTLAPASIVIPIDFARLPLIALVGALFYDESVGWSLALGAALIIAGNLINLKRFG